MGKNLRQQARGKGGPRYRSPSFNFKGRIAYHNDLNKPANGMISDIIHCSGHSAPLADVLWEGGQHMLLPTAEGIRVGGELSAGSVDKSQPGNVLTLKDIPEGTSIFNIESKPGDGGKFVRSAGAFAKIDSRLKNETIIILPSGKKRAFHNECKACIGIIAGSGKTEKPFLKAGNMHFAKRARNKMWPIVCGTSQNAVDHPFGGSSSAIKGRPTQASRNAPPGRKVGKIAPRRTGRRKR